MQDGLVYCNGGGWPGGKSYCNTGNCIARRQLGGWRIVSQYNLVYCDLKAAGGLALYCNTMHSQDMGKRWARAVGLCDTALGAATRPGAQQAQAGRWGTQAAGALGSQAGALSTQRAHGARGRQGERACEASWHAGERGQGEAADGCAQACGTGQHGRCDTAAAPATLSAGTHDTAPLRPRHGMLARAWACL